MVIAHDFIRELRTFDVRSERYALKDFTLGGQGLKVRTSSSSSRVDSGNESDKCLNRIEWLKEGSETVKSELTWV